MGSVHSTGRSLAIALLFTLPFVGCGSSHPGPPLFPGHINLSPSSTTSITSGGTFGFTASVQTISGTTLNTPITFSSSDTAILNLAPNGVACAGHWDVSFSICSPGASGPVTVTASALGASSVPTFVFVHPPIDNIAVVGVLSNGVQVQEPCLSQSQSMTVEAHAFSNGSDITASVGPFTWSANNTAVVTLTPLTNNTFHFPTNQATAVANTPGITYIFASANGVTSSSFQQPQVTNSQGTASPVLDFFATCPVQNIALELGAVGSRRTTFSVPKGSASQTVFATVTDIMGNSSLPRTDNGLVLSKIPLVWTSSQPGAIEAGSGCTQSCGLTPSSAGTATITASCSPPTCNIGFPTIPNAFLTQGLIDQSKITACTNYFHALYPQLTDCQELIPVPVYASPVFIDPGKPQDPPQELSPTAAISGIVIGSTANPTVFASSTGCKNEPPSTCNTSAYSFSTTSSPGSSNQIPVSPNSFLFDPTGARVWMGSDFGAEIVNPGNFGTANPPFTSLGTVTGNVLATSLNGGVAVFSDTKHIPNQVYVVNAGNTASPAALSIPSASLAAFTPDGLKTYIVGGGGTSMYIYSASQALQGPFPLAGSARAIAFSPNAAFTFIAESGSSPNLTAFANCTNPAVAPIQPAATIPLPADPILMKVLPALHIDGRDSLGNLIPDGAHILILDSTGFDIVTATISTPSAGTLCPQGIQFTSGDPLHTVQRIELGQGTLQPVNFFYSTDDTLLYVVDSNSSSIIVYSFVNGSVIGGIQLQNNATPLSADMAPDGGTIVIAGSDGMLHEVSTALGGNDAAPISFPNIPNGLNPFCSFDPGGVPCTLNVVQAKP